MFEPTDEQRAAVEAFATLDSLKINAFAGTGKTATLRLMAQSTQRRGLYLAFNKAIASEAKRIFPSSVSAATSHSLAFRSVVSKGFSRDQMIGKLNARGVAQALGLGEEAFLGKFSLSSTNLAYLVAETIRSYAYSDVPSINDSHVPMPGRLALLSVAQKAELCHTVSGHARSMWSNMCNPSDDQFPLGHDGYFKLWSLSKPKLQQDFILLDEAQDSNPALLSVLRAQSCQVVLVGDRFQQIYEWRGGVNAMETDFSSATLSLTQSFRFGPQLAELANKIISTLEPSAAIHGMVTIESRLGCRSPRTVLARTNASLVAFMMGALEGGRIPYIVGGIAELKWMLEDVRVLKSGRPATHPEFFGFNNWHEVLQFVDEMEGSHLVTFVKMVQSFGEERILRDLLRTAARESDSNVTLSTVHKAKGLEWCSVMLADDFCRPSPVTDANEKKLKGEGCIFFDGSEDQRYAIKPEEIRLLYVAVTRAKLRLHVPDWCAEFFSCPQEAIVPDIAQLPIGAAVEQESHREEKQISKLPTEVRRSESLPHVASKSFKVNWLWLIIALLVVAFLLK